MVIRTCKKHGHNGNMVLILDPSTSKIISSCLRVNELIDNGILAIENLHCSREPLANYPALYFIDTTPQSIEQVITDFSSKNIIKRKMYSSAHVFFTRSIPDEIMEKIESTELVDHLGTLSEINIDFTTIENRIFTLATPRKLPVYYWGQRELLEYRIKSDSVKLLSLFITLNDCPAVRYDSTSKLASKFAEIFAKDLTSIRKNSSWTPNTNGCVLIIDRSTDPLTPLMHEFTYQALAYDICGHNNGEVLYINHEDWTPDMDEKTLEKKQMILNDVEDSLWAEHRHRHIGLVPSKITSEYKKFKKTNKMAKWQDQKKGNGDISAKDMSLALRDFHEYTKLMSKFDKHLDLSKECIGKVDTRKLKELAELEQELATGFNEDGDKIVLKDAIRTLKSLCMHKAVGIEERIRIVLIFLITMGEIQQAVLDQLFANVNPLVKRVFTNLDKIIGSRIFGNKSYKGPLYSSVRKREGEARCENIKYLRYVPLIWELGHFFVLDKLSEQKFKFVGNGKFDPNSSRAGAATNTSGLRGRRGKKGDRGSTTTSTSTDNSANRGFGADEKENNPNANNLPYMVIFVIGGITYSEAKAIYEVNQEHNVNIILGGSEMLTPRSYLANLADCTIYDWVRACGPSQCSGVNVKGYLDPAIDKINKAQSGKSLIELEQDEVDRLEGRIKSTPVLAGPRDDDDDADDDDNGFGVAKKDKKGQSSAAAASRGKKSNKKPIDDSDSDDIPEPDFEF